MLARYALTLLTATAFLSSCGLMGGIPLATLGTRSIAGNQIAVQDRDFADDFRKLIPKQPYVGPVSIKIDTALDQASSAQRRLYSLSNAHLNQNQHSKGDQGKYFDPDSLSSSLDAHVGDTQLADSGMFTGVIEINGQKGEQIPGYLEVKIKAGKQADFDSFLKKYDAKILHDENSVYLIQLDLTKVKLSALSENIREINSFIPSPITSISFSSLAQAQTAAALFDLLLSNHDNVDFALPVSVPELPFVNDGGQRPIIRRSSSDPIIDTAEQATVLPSGAIDYRFSSTFNWVRDIELPQARLDSTGANVTVAIQDSGFDLLAVPDISQSRYVLKTNHMLFPVWAFNENNSDVAASFMDAGRDYTHAFHGTFTTTLIGAEMDNGIGAVGVAPRANLIQTRAFFGNEHFQGIVQAVAKRAKVIIVNSDWPCTPLMRLAGIAWIYSSFRYSNNGDIQRMSIETVTEAVGGAHATGAKYAADNNVTFVAPVGNANLYIDLLDNPLKILDPGMSFIFPACIPSVIAVGGAMQGFPGNLDYNVRWNDIGRPGSSNRTGSNYGPAVDMYAPGDWGTIEASSATNDPGATNALRGDFGGTSAAGPIAAGVAALVLSKNPNLPPAEVLGHLQQKYRPGGPKRFIREPNGRLVPFINAFESLRYLNTGGQREALAVELVGKIKSVAGSTGFFLSDATNCGYFINLNPQFMPDPVDPDKPLTIAGWYKQHNGSRVPDQFEVIALRETPSAALCSTSPYRVRGYVGDAGTGGGVPNVDVELRPGTDACDGDVLARTVTDSSGHYEFANIAEGRYTVTISRTGYVRICSNVSVSAAEPNGSTGATVVTTPSLPSNATRFVLVWGETPSDLDSHLTGPRADGGRFHLYYSEPSYSDSQTVATLDRDDTSSFGPETITTTVYGGQSGKFRYSVHDYSNSDSTSSTALSRAGASVLVFQGDQLVRTIQPQPGLPGTLWDVLEMDGTTGAITVLNTMSFESDSSAIGQESPGGGPVIPVNAFKRTNRKPSIR